jgi:hypothetical protein
MAKQEVGLKIDVDIKSVGNMKQELRAATQELIAVNEKFGSTSTQAVAAAKRVASLKDAIGDAKALADTFNPDKKFVALGGAVQGAVAGFSALQGAIGLFGSESKDVEKILLKVQSAMALQQGISGVAGAMDSMKLLAGTIKTQVVTAFSTLRGAILATGIGALGIAVALVAANFEEFKKKIFSLIPGLQTAANFIGGLVTKFTDFVGITNEAERNLDKFTKANKRANEGIDAQIKLLEAQGGKEDQVYNLKKQRSENELNTLRESLKAKGKLSEEELKQFRDLKTEQQVLDIEEANRKKKLAEDEAKRQKELAAKSEEKRKQDAAKKKEEVEAEKKRLAELQKNTEENLKENAKRTKELQDQLRLSAITDEKEKAKVENQIKFQNELDAETERFKAGELRLEQYLLNLALIRQRYANDQKAKDEEDKNAELTKQSEKLLKDAENDALSFEERLAKIQERQALENQIVFASEEDRKKFIAENEKAITDIKLLEGQARVANAQFAADQLSAIAQIVGQDTAAGKALSIAAATISTYLSAQKAYESQFKPVAIVDSPVRGAIAAGVAVATGIANIRKIMAVPVPARGGGGAGGGAGISTAAPVAPQLAPQVMATQVNTAAVNQMGNRAARAYVLNSDIQNEQQRNAYIDRNASIGNP